MTLLLATAGWALCPACKWAERKDRFEGVVDHRQVAGEACRLLGVLHRGSQASGQAGKLLNLYFWLPRPQEISIEVWEPRTNYWMVPKNKSYPQGRQVFSWPRDEVVGPLGLSPESLYAKVEDAADHTVYPAFLSASDRPAVADGYEFVFEAGAGLDVKCTLSREDGGKLTPVASFRHVEDDPGVFRLPWDGRDGQGRPAPEGRYVLNLKGQLLGESITPLNRDVRFWRDAPPG